MVGEDFQTFICKAAGATRHGTDNLSVDILKQLLKRKTDSYAERLADKLAWFVDKALIHVGSLPRVVTRFCNGAEGILLKQPGGPGKPPKLRPICMGGLFSKARGYYLNRACGS